MSLKIIFIPFSLILVLVLLIGYMKPDYDAYVLKQMTHQSSVQQLNQMTKRLGNITSVSSGFASSFSEALGGKNEEEVLIDQYVPESMDQEHIVDALNYLAGQSGVLISSVVIEKPLVNAAADAAADQAMNSQSIILNGAGTANAVASADSVIALKSIYPGPKSYQATLTVSSDFASISSFFDLIYRMNRENEVKSFSLKKDTEKKDDKGNPVVNSTLNATIVVSFMYYPGLTNASIQNVEALPLFSGGNLDTKTIDFIKSKIQEHSLPELTVGDFAVRTNPFAQ